MTNALQKLAVARDALAQQIKTELSAAEFGNVQVPDAPGQTRACHALIGSAEQLASTS